MRTTLSLFYLVSSLGLAAFALPVDGAPHAAGHLIARKSCPKLKSLPAHWNNAEQDDSSTKGWGWTSIFPWKKGSSQKIAISLNEKESDAQHCVYDIPGGWNGGQAYVLAPLQTGSKTFSRRTYNDFVGLYRRIGRVLAETKVGSRPAAVLSVASGKKYYATERWNEFFNHELSRNEPSDEAYRLCVDLMDGFYDDVTDAVADYAQTYGVVYDLDSFSFQESVLWNDEMTRMGIRLIEWSPNSVGVWPAGTPVNEARRTAWREQISKADLQPASGYWASKHANVEGVCEQFNPSNKGKGKLPAHYADSDSESSSYESEVSSKYTSGSSSDWTYGHVDIHGLDDMEMEGSGSGEPEEQD